MKKILFILIIYALIGTDVAAAKKKEEIQLPTITLTLNDGSVINGLLRSNLHYIKKNISVSETADGKKEKYQLTDIDSLVVTYVDGEKMTLRPIYVWNGFFKKVDKTPVLANVCYSSDKMTCYMVPGRYEKTTAAVPSNYFQSTTTRKNAWLYYKQIKKNGDRISLLYTYIPSKKIPKVKSILSDIKNNFEKEEFRFIKETIETEGVTAEELIDKPWRILKILERKD